MSVKHLSIARLCRGCGCTDERACPGGCAWVLLDIDAPAGVCSQCAEDLQWNPLALASVGFDELMQEAS